MANLLWWSMPRNSCRCSGLINRFRIYKSPAQLFYNSLMGLGVNFGGLRFCISALVRKIDQIMRAPSKRRPCNLVSRGEFLEFGACRPDADPVFQTTTSGVAKTLSKRGVTASTVKMATRGDQRLIPTIWDLKNRLTLGR